LSCTAIREATVVVAARVRDDEACAAFRELSQHRLGLVVADVRLCDELRADRSGGRLGGVVSLLVPAVVARFRRRGDRNLFHVCLLDCRRSDRSPRCDHDRNGSENGERAYRKTPMHLVRSSSHQTLFPSCRLDDWAPRLVRAGTTVER
jgi:hypothetical protein